MTKASRYFKCLCYSALLALVALSLFSLLPCPPVIAAPVLTLSASSGPVGTSVTVTGTVFASYEGDTIHILFDTTEISPVVVPSTGSFSTAWTIPSNASGGTHIIGAKRETTDSSFFISASFNVDPRQLTLSINEGTTGTAVSITGAGFYINEGVTLSYFNSTNSTIGTVAASSTGKFSRSFTIPAGPAGLHKFSASNTRGNTAEAAYKIIPDIKLGVDSGAPGELIDVHGSGFGAKGTVTLSLDTLNVASTPADDYGSFETQFTIPQMPLSTHYLKVQDNLGNKTDVIFPVTAGAVLSQNNGPVGNPITVNGNGFQSGSTISITYDGKPVASTIADNNGKFTVAFEVPSSSSGNHMISVTDGITTRRYPYSVESVPPPAPTPLSPAQNSITSAYAMLNWQTVTDPSIPVTYEIQVSADKNFTNIVLHKTAIAVTQYNIEVDEGLKAEPPVSVYYWRVMAIDGAGNRGTWSESWQFIVAVPPAPVVVMPADGAKVDFPIGFNWKAVISLSGPVTYNIQVSRNNVFSELLIDEKGITSAVYTVPLESRKLFNKKIPYYWRAKAVDSAKNAGDWSGAGSFNIASSGFPAWATYTLIGLGAVILALLAFRYGRRTAYH